MTGKKNSVWLQNAAAIFSLIVIPSFLFFLVLKLVANPWFRLWFMLGGFGCYVSLLLRYIRGFFPFGMIRLDIQLVCTVSYSLLLFLSGPIAFWVAIMDGSKKKE